jgi:hypothetical protein
MLPWVRDCNIVCSSNPPITSDLCIVTGYYLNAHIDGGRMRGMWTAQSAVQ